MFATIDKDGRTPAADPKLAAYKYMYMLQRQGRATSLIVENGEYTVKSPGLMTIIYVEGKS